ncbi:Lactam utilization protein lamB [Fulvia fulva]|uniref:Lactam utilization protein lamB n=1 Tax=Passalora fulva TaxID=5499 RepID=A0A9Q8LA86_PASFU|nr:Lactam utilization protein lamB [Fulvia fulva]KAK4631371.1 Lactam utilization protein lamB [Fulvia fulva]KAK4633800.1 Lactam utilization protein lamB [Fulvia fulva]UJO13647.1 Lactam utilization protein lamB [Fulvia fulva]WPV11416.1 Lactam utilization protein lamB [Fulvia fulva]WPV26282.1 Lactam utilization protein lamB [Fulvia fulva]
MPPLNKKVVDLGEGYGNFKCGPDEDLIPMIDHANIACGFHAGDPLIMQQTVKLVKAHNIKAGAHPGLPDIQGFGRREMKLTPEELTAMVRYQVGALQGFLDAEGVPLHHVKPHGVLYGMMYRDEEVCRAVYEGVPKGVRVFGLAGTFHEKVAKELGLPFTAELYGDVKYSKDGRLVIDRKKKAWTKEETENHISSQVRNSSVTAVTGEDVELPVNAHDQISLCCHSDSPGAIEIVTAARRIVDAFNKQMGY